MSQTDDLKQRERAIDHFLESQNLAHHVWTFDGVTFSLADVINRELEAVKQIAMEADTNWDAAAKIGERQR